MGPAMKICTIAVAVLCLTAVAAQDLTTFTAMYGPVFNSSCHDTLHFEGEAGFFTNSLQLTQNLYTNPLLGNTLTNQAGRVTLKKPFKLWEQGYNKTSERVASFNSSFLFNIDYAGNESAQMGEGLAFIIAPNVSLQSSSFGQYLGLTTYNTDGLPENQLVAIEVDNVKEDFDPDANHVGLDINSVISNVTSSLTPFGMEISPTNQSWLYNVWVQYDGVHKVIEVYIARAEIVSTNLVSGVFTTNIPSRPNTPVLKSDLDLGEVLNQYSYFGFSGSTGSGVQLNGIFGWNLTVESYTEEVVVSPIPPALVPASAPPLESKHPSWKNTLLVVEVGVPLLVMMAAMTGHYYLRKKRSMAQVDSKAFLGTLKRLPATPREFQFNELKKATNNFDEKQKLGQGGFGVVYRGHLHNENLEVAVKRFSRESMKGQNDFLAELTIINRLRHKHLVPLLGWCHNEGMLLLVYDYMPNGSLDAHLFKRTPNSKPLSWDLRYNIISGVASALHYLHNEYDQKVVHRDIKASNIMLDSNFNARLGDFGLARALDKEKTWYTEAGVVAGTPGYIAPECFHTGKATQKSDIYAFGIVLLEIVCGLQPGTVINGFECLVDWVWSLHEEGRILDVVEEQLGDEYVVEEAKKVLVLALACSHPIASERPKTQAIVQIISGLVPVPCVPPFKPAFVWPMPHVLGPNISSLFSTTETTRSFQMTHSVSGFTPQCISREFCATDKFATV